MTIGKIEILSLDITSPMAIKADINFENLTILTGMNGTGKTFIHVNTWALSHIINFCIVTKSVVNKGFVKYIYDRVFSNQNITGKISGYFESATISIEFNEGEVINLETTNIDKLDGVQNVTFMSSGMRKFDNISLYLKMRKAFNIGGIEHGKLMERLSDDFKLYDLVYIEGLIARMPVYVGKNFFEALENLGIKDEIEEFGVDLEVGDFFVKLSDGKHKYLCTYSAGDQSVINMVLGSMPNTEPKKPEYLFPDIKKS